MTFSNNPNLNLGSSNSTYTPPDDRFSNFGNTTGGISFDNNFTGSSFANAFTNTSNPATGNISVDNANRSNNLETAQQGNARALQTGINAASPNDNGVDNETANQLNFNNQNSIDSRNQYYDNVQNNSLNQANAAGAASANAANASTFNGALGLAGNQFNNFTQESINTANLGANERIAARSDSTARFGIQSSAESTRYLANANLEASKYNADASRFNTLLGIGNSYISGNSNQSYRPSFNR
jgi:hypothetical protein